MKPISTRVHGVLDYMTAGLLCALPRALGWDRTVTRLLDSASAAATGYSALTNYELGLVRVLPMKAHLVLDALSGGTLIGAALMLEDEGPEVRGTLAALGVYEVAAALLTQTHSPVEKAKSDERSRSGKSGAGTIGRVAQSVGTALVQGL